jgi:transposase
MAQTSFSFKKRQHFLQLTIGIAPHKILFSPIDGSNHFHVALFHDISGRLLSDFFHFSASKMGFASFTSSLDELFSTHAPELVFIGMEPTSVYYEALLHNLHQRYADSASPKLQLCIVDPAPVKDNRHQHSLRLHKSDQVDAAAIGELLMRALYIPAPFCSPQATLADLIFHNSRHSFLFSFVTSS